MLRDTMDQDLDITTRKLRLLCPADIEVAATTGLCGRRLYTILLTFAKMMFGDIQELESLNSLLKIQSRKAPNASLELVDARVRLKNNCFKNQTPSQS